MTNLGLQGPPNIPRRVSLSAARPQFSLTAVQPPLPPPMSTSRSHTNMAAPAGSLAAVAYLQLDRGGCKLQVKAEHTLA